MYSHYAYKMIDYIENYSTEKPVMKIIQDALTFDDVLLLPAHSTVLPKQVKLQTQLTRTIQLNIPLVSSAMDTVTEARLAIAMAQEGGIGIIHKNMSVSEQVNEIRKVKKFESGVVKNPITVNPTITVKELIELTQLNKISGVPVVEGNQLVGIVTARDLRFETNLSKKISAVMTKKDRLVTAKEHATRDEIRALLHQNRIEKVLLVDDQFQLKGLVTVKDIQKALDYPHACKDQYEQLRVGAAVSVGVGSEERIEALIHAGVDVIVIDTAHGHSQGVIDKVRWVKKNYGDKVQVIGGNIATAAAAQALADAGADAVKVGIGPGSICTTRIVTGVGVPQITAIANVASGLQNTTIPLIADGGIRFSGDVCKALAAGAFSVMIGSMFAGTEEAPGEVELYQGRAYKSYRGMGSLGAMAQSQGSSDRYFQEFIDDAKKLVPEGIEGRVPYKGYITAIIHQILGGLRSCMGYTGCETIEALRTQAEFIKVTSAGIRESHVHDVRITKEAPNYSLD